MGPFEFSSIMIQCESCERGRSLENSELLDLERVIVCSECKHEFTILDGIINSITSDSPFAIYEFISTKRYSGKVSFKVGECHYINFPKDLQHIYKVFITPEAPCIVEATQIWNGGFLLVSGCLTERCKIGNMVNAGWTAYGQDDNFNEPWRQLLVDARQVFLSGNYIGSILLSEIAFESFIDACLGAGYRRVGLDDDSISRFLVSTEMIAKVNPLMNNLYGLKLSKATVWGAWEKKVLKWRNDIAHGRKISASKEEAQLTFKTIIHAIFYFHKTVYEKCNVL